MNITYKEIKKKISQMFAKLYLPDKDVVIFMT